MFIVRQAARFTVWVGLMLVLAACSGGGGGGGSGGGASPTPAYTIGGTITGSAGGGLVLQDNGADNLSISPGATSFTFATSLASGVSYSVTVLTQPTSPSQTCTVSNGSGAVSGTNVTGIAISCVDNSAWDQMIWSQDHWG